jgi:hypothetical protein
MTESKQDEIINRLHKFEKQNWYMKLGGLAVVFLVLTTLSTGTSKKPEIAEEIRAKRIVMVDEHGKGVITLEYTNNASHIVVSDSKEMIRFCLAVNDEYCNLHMWDSKGKNRFSLGAYEWGSDLYMCNSKGISGFGLSSKDEGSSLNIYDSEANQRVCLTSSDDNNDGGLMEIRNKTNEHVVKLGVDEYGNGVVGAYNRKGLGRTLTPEP